MNAERLDTTLINKVINRIHGGHYVEVYSVLLYKYCKFVLEEYFK